MTPESEDGRDPDAADDRFQDTDLSDPTG